MPPWVFIKVSNLCPFTLNSFLGHFLWSQKMDCLFPLESQRLGLCPLIPSSRLALSSNTHLLSFVLILFISTNTLKTLVLPVSSLSISSNAIFSVTSTLTTSLFKISTPLHFLFLLPAFFSLLLIRSYTYHIWS